MDETEKIYLLRKLEELQQQQKPVVVHTGSSSHQGKVGGLTDGWLELIQERDKISFIHIPRITSIQYSL